MYSPTGNIIHLSSILLLSQSFMVSRALARPAAKVSQPNHEICVKFHSLKRHSQQRSFHKPAIQWPLLAFGVFTEQ